MNLLTKQKTYVQKTMFTNGGREKDKLGVWNYNVYQWGKRER